MLRVVSLAQFKETIMIVGYKKVPVDPGDGGEMTQECIIVSENNSVEDAEASMASTITTYQGDTTVESYFYAFRTTDSDYEVFAVVDKPI